MKKFGLPLLVFCLATFLALYNIGNFPKMMGDEGIYVSQAYWLSYLGKLGPYTYWYDHFPLGWAQIGLWQLLVGTTRFFGYSVLSTRVFMGIILGCTTVLIYLLLKRLTNSKLTSILGSILYISSSLTLTFGRMVLLDNIAIFWFLLSLVIFYGNPTKIKNLAFSSATLALAILSKESLLFFLPPYLIALYLENRKNPFRNYALLVSGVTIFFLLSFFPLLAILKSELLPQSNHVSFLGTLLFQAGRGSGIPFWQVGSHLRSMVSVWYSIDPFFLAIGALSTVVVFLLKIPLRTKFISLYAIFFSLFLVRGGQIYDFYIIPILPLFAINIAILIHKLTEIKSRLVLQTIFIISLLLYFFGTNSYPLTSLATYPQKQAIDTLKNLPTGRVIVANNYEYLDLYLDHKNAIEWYQKVETDPDVQKSLGSISNILVDEQFRRELESGQLPYLKSELLKEAKITQFGKEIAPGAIIKPYSSELISFYEKSQNNGASSQIVKITKNDPAILDELRQDPPYALLIDSSIFSSSSDLEKFIKDLKTNHPWAKTIVVQDDTGTNTLPWISTLSRDFYKSSEEAILATQKKSQAIKALGISGAVITSSSNQDGFTGAIIEAARPYLTPVLRYNDSIPQGNTPILVTNNQEITTLKDANYSGEILTIITDTKYLKEN